MRCRSSKQGGGNNNNKGGVMEIEKLKKLKEEPHLSGAYIRSLVKQLTSSRTKDPLSPKPLDNISSDGAHDHHPHSSPHENPNNSTNSSSDQNPQNQNPHHQQQPKKQVRRRLHTSRPYQERLLNMAEARREIVTALKFHRASMKQANDQQQQQNTTQHESIPAPFVQSPPPPPQQEERMKYRRNPRIYPSNNNNTNTTNLDYINNLSSYSSSFSCPLPPSNNNPFFCPSTSSIAPLPIIDNLNLNLPNQPLGLNLNFHDFTNIDTNLYHNTPTTTNNNHNNNNQSSMNMYTYSSSSPSSSSSPPLVDQDPHHPMMTDINEYSGGLHPMLDDDEMAEIRSIGEQHEMEWNDTLNLVKSAWWFKFMKKMEITNSPLERKGELDDGFNVFDEVMEFPAWMDANNNESCFLQQHLDDYYSQDYLQEPALPCMDIGEIDGMDGEWLA